MRHVDIVVSIFDSIFIRISNLKFQVPKYLYREPFVNLNKFLKNIEETLPSICTDKDLIDRIPSLFKNNVYLFRLRQKKEAPPHFQTPNKRVTYLREDVIDWLRKSYNEQKNFLEECASNDCKN